MKDKCFKESQLKKKLQFHRNSGKYMLQWKLSEEDVSLIRKWGYVVEPYLYEITTRQFHNLRLIKSALIKDIHYANKKGKKHIVTSLEKKDKEVLDEYRIRYRAVKYRIYLQK